MNKKDIPILVLLVALWIAWPPIYKKYFAKPAPAAEQAEVDAASATNTAATTLPRETTLTKPAAEAEVAEAPAPAPAAEAEPAAPAVPEEPAEPARKVVLADDALEVTLTSRGAGVEQVLLKDYRTTVDPESGPKILDFSDAPALVYRPLPSWRGNGAFQVDEVEPGREVRFVRVTDGIRLERTIRLDDGYMLTVTDSFTPTGDGLVKLPAQELQLGPMRNSPGQKAVRGMVSLGVDTMLNEGEKVKHWGRKIPRWFAKDGPDNAEKSLPMPMIWTAVKSKFFAQIYAPKEGIESCMVFAKREPVKHTVSEVRANVAFRGMEMAPDQPYVREATFYVGPKKYTELHRHGLHQAKVMELGWAAPISVALLYMLNFIHDHVWPFNYGLAIMLVTIIVRVLFWPLTHKGTENMKRMQELQPLMKEIKEKYKDNAQKQQKAMMELYKKHKVNPMMGCLPMMIQIPVFIALFFVLRSAIELRFAEFLWVKDLSSPERIIEFGTAIPLIGWDALNILPLLMAVTTLVQQKLTPTAGDPSQQKMMMMMPLVMLIFLYNYAAGLVLYWTTNNILMIVQQTLQRRKAKQHPLTA